MSERLMTELNIVLKAARSSLEYLFDLGEVAVPRPVPLNEMPICPIGESRTSVGEPCRPESLEDVRRDLGECCRCGLGQTRDRLVFGIGNPAARLVLVGEAPGKEEDRRGEPFVGEAGQLLDRILQAMKLDRSDVYICNVLKCRPPQNRDPLPEEIEAANRS